MYIKNRLKVSTSKGFRRFVYDSHVSLGIYAVAFLLLMSLTGPTWSFGWYKNAAQSSLGMQEEMRVDQNHGGHNGQMKPMEKGKDALTNHKMPQTNARKKQKAEEVNVMHAGGNQSMQRANFHMLMSSLHMGRWAGWFSKLLYLIAALIGASLPLSGYYMWWKRIQAKRKSMK